MTTRKPRPSWLVAEPDPPSKRSILDAALRLFVRHGLDGTNIRMIAKESGYTNPAMFKFFASKDALALYLFERCYGRLYGAVAAAARGGTPRQALGRVLDAFVAEMDEDLEAALFLQDGLRELWPRLPAASRRRSILRTLRALVERGMREGSVTGFRSPEVPVAAVVGLVAQFARMLYFGEIRGPARAHRDELQRALTGMLGG